MERLAPCSGGFRDKERKRHWPAASRPSSTSRAAASSPALAERSVSVTLVGTWVEMQTQAPPTPVDEESAGCIWGSSVIRSQHLPAC